MEAPWSGTTRRNTPKDGINRDQLALPSSCHTSGLRCGDRYTSPADGEGGSCSHEDRSGHPLRACCSGSGASPPRPPIASLLCPGVVSNMSQRWRSGSALSPSTSALRCSSTSTFWRRKESILESRTPVNSVGSSGSSDSSWDASNGGSHISSPLVDGYRCSRPSEKQGSENSARSFGLKRRWKYG